MCCSSAAALISTEYPGSEAATKWLFERFGIEYIVNPEQTCCTGLGYYTDLCPSPPRWPSPRATPAWRSRPATRSRSYLCSTCYAINKKAHRVLEEPEHRREDNRALAGIGREYDDGVAARHPAPPRARGPLVAHKLVPAWSAAAWAASRWPPIPPATTARSSPTRCSGDSENLMVAEDLLEPAGVIRTGYYNEKTTHCGAGFRQRFVNPVDVDGGDPGEAAPPGRREGRRLRAHVPQLRHPVRPPPRHHRATSHEEYPFVHLHVQQLLALALGADPDTVCGVGSHSQDLEPLLQRIGARHR